MAFKILPITFCFLPKGSISKMSIKSGRKVFRIQIFPTSMPGLPNRQSNAKVTHIVNKN